MQVIVGNWYVMMPPEAAYPALVLAAIVCGAIVGVEREKKIKPAGLRTMILIALGSALFTMISVIMADHGGDRGRIAAQIVTGIGFLGAGSILHDAVRIRGLTTAAMIWFMAAIGMLCGAGYGGAAVAMIAAVALLLLGVTWIENRFLGPCFYTQVTICFDDDSGKTAIKIDALLDDFQIPPNSVNKVTHENGLTEMTLTYCNAHKHHKTFLSHFAEMPAVKSIIRHG
ncbi:MAG: MgtC/SapB family protein [Methylomonas sp.]|nr:MgtC/SapB family protein [Methylomonas sp.]